VKKLVKNHKIYHEIVENTKSRKYKKNRNDFSEILISFFLLNFVFSYFRGFRGKLFSF